MSWKKRFSSPRNQEAMRSTKPLLAPSEYLLRQHRRGSAFEDSFPLPMGPLGFAGQTGCKLGNPVIQKRESKLEGIRHRHAINLDQNVVRQIGFVIHVIENGGIRGIPGEVP